MEKMKMGKLVSVIYIGSSSVKMKVSQIQCGKLVEIDVLEYPVLIGHEIFLEGRMSFDSISEIIKVLKNYENIINEYGIKKYKVIATSVINRAANITYVLDQIKIQNNMTVEVLEYSSEKTLTCFEVMNMIDEDYKKCNNILIAIVSTGNISLPLYENKKVKLVRDIPVGSIKLNDLLGGIRDKVFKYYEVLNEYLDVSVGQIIKGNKFKNVDKMILIGSRSLHITELIKCYGDNEDENGNRKGLSSLYKSIKQMPIDKLAEKYNLSNEQADIIYSSIIIYWYLAKNINVKDIRIIKFDLWDVLSKQMLIPQSKNDYEENIRLNALTSAKSVVDRYGCDKEHYNAVINFCECIFNTVKKTHGLNAKNFLFLQIAAIFHECGYYITSDNIISSTFSIISNTAIYGLSKHEVSIIAMVAVYAQMDNILSESIYYMYLSEKEKILVSKLSAILKLANSLDRSHKQKLKLLNTKLNGKTLTITLSSIMDISIENWEFQRSALFFEDVFGIKPIFKFKSLLL